MSDYIVQKAVFPKLELCSEKRLYFRFNSLVNICLSKQEIGIFKGGRLLTNTYFNSISIGKIKKYTHLKSLFFRLKFFGKIKITWKVKALLHSDRIVQEDLLSSSQLQEAVIPLPFWDELSDGMLFFEVEGLVDSQIFDFTYLTSQAPLREVKLGIVITHFNRQEVLINALQRLKEKLLPDDYYATKISICVVDNSRNFPNTDEVKILKNPNLGGAGGFTRGLLHFQQQGEFSHCLFMDDDASCEIESIQKTLFYLAYVDNDNIAISGAMLREIEPYMQHENGGVFNGLCHSVKCYFNLLKTKDILLNEREERVDYGAWWFFAFPIPKVKYLAFPYFVRGDDISFSLANKFDILTVNGICSWQVDFSYKSGPLQIYLDQRNHIMHFLQNLVVGGNNKLLFKTSMILFVLNALTCQYESARAATLAIQDVLEGPDFWIKNVGMQAKRAQFKEFVKIEKIVEVPSELKKTAVKGRIKESKLTKLLRVVSLNGHLIPEFFFKKVPMWQYKYYGVRLREIFLYKKGIFYTNLDATEGVILEHNKNLFFRYLWEHCLTVYQLFSNLKSLKKQYQDSYKVLTSEDFWKSQFDRKDI